MSPSPNTMPTQEPLVLDLGHLVLHVKDLEAALDFYQKVLGFHVSDSEHKVCCKRVKLSTGGGEIVLFESDEFSPLGLGPQGLGTPLQLHVQDFAKAAGRLEEQGVRVHRDHAHAGTVWDPSGNAIGLYDRLEDEGRAGHRTAGRPHPPPRRP